MILAWLALLAASAAVAVVYGAAITWVKDGKLFDLLARLTVAFAFVSLSVWADGSSVGVLGLCVTFVLAGVLTVTWSVSREHRMTVPDDLSGEDTSWLSG